MLVPTYAKVSRRWLKSDLLQQSRPSSSASGSSVTTVRPSQAQQPPLTALNEPSEATPSLSLNLAAIRPSPLPPSHSLGQSRAARARDTVDTKRLECYYWRSGGCRLPESVCLYAHRSTGLPASGPVSTGTGRKFSSYVLS